MTFCLVPNSPQHQSLHLHLRPDPGDWSAPAADWLSEEGGLWTGWTTPTAPPPASPGSSARWTPPPTVPPPPAHTQVRVDVSDTLKQSGSGHIRNPQLLILSTNKTNATRTSTDSVNNKSQNTHFKIWPMSEWVTCWVTIYRETGSVSVHHKSAATGKKVALCLFQYKLTG